MRLLILSTASGAVNIGIPLADSLGFHHGLPRQLFPRVLHTHITRDTSIQASWQKILLLNQNLPHTAHLPVRSWPNLFAGKEKLIVQLSFFLVQHSLYLLSGYYKRSQQHCTDRTVEWPLRLTPHGPHRRTLHHVVLWDKDKQFANPDPLSAAFAGSRFSLQGKTETICEQGSPTKI
jgi:hypothetical protein